MKKLTAVILTLCLLMGLIPTAAFGVGDADEDFPSGEFQVIGEPDADGGEDYASWKAAAYGNADAALMSGDDKFHNDFLEVCVHPNGQFTMGTTGGDPHTERDNNKLLLFGHPTAYTSETVIRINGVDYFFQGSANSQHVGNSNETVRTIDGVEIKQILTPVENPMTGREDIVKIQYECRNVTSEAKTVGVRIMLDTMLGDNDGAPFRVGEERLTSEKEYVYEKDAEGRVVKDEIPRYWLCFDRFDDPSVTSVGTLYTNDAERPDKVQFASWPDIIGSAWDYRVNSNRHMSDTAVAVYFNESDVAGGQTKSAVTYYGISETTPPPPGELAMRIVKPAKLIDAGNGDYENNPFDITVYLKNTGGTPLNNVKINLDLTGADALEIVEGGEKAIASLAAGEEDAAQWTVKAKPQSADTTVSYRVTGDYDGQSAQSVVDLSTELEQLAITHNVTFNAEGAEPIVVQVSHNGSLAESDIPPVPEKAGYAGSWNQDDLNKLNNVTADITVNAVYVPVVQSVTMAPASVTLTIGETATAQLTATVLPEAAPDKSVTWISYNEDVAKVDANGVVTAVAVGAATIEAKANADESKSAACAVTVQAVVTGIEVTAPKPWEMFKGQSLDITGLEVRAVYSDNTKVLVTDYALTGYDPNPKGLGELILDDEGGSEFIEYVDETLTVTYTDQRTGTAFKDDTTCVVRVKRLPATLGAIVIRRTPNKRLNYVQGEKLNLDGMIVDIVNTDNDPPKTVEFKNGNIPQGFTVTGYDASRLGNQAVTISYADPDSQIVKSMQFYVRVLPSANAQPTENNVLQPRVSLESAQGSKIVTLSYPVANGSQDPSNNLPSGGNIYYTLDGSVPTASSAKYENPFTVTQTTTVKAITVVNGAKSPVTSAQVYLPQAVRPIVANLHHRNNQGLNRSTTKLEPGTLVSLISDTAGASIYYYIGNIQDNQMTAENCKYGTSIYLKPEYADANKQVTIKAYATKDGYQNSSVATFVYELNIPDVIPETATISVGRVTSRSGENIAPTLSINATSNATEPNKIRNFSVKILYDAGVMQFQSVSPLANGAEIFSSCVESQRSGVVTLQYNGTEPLDLGEMCSLNFRALDSAENNSYDLTIDQSAVSVNLTNAGAMLYDFVNGLISIVGAHNSQLAAATTIVDGNGNAISSADALEAGDSFMASVTIALPEGSADASLSAAGENSLKTLNIFMAIYDKDQAMVSLESWDIDVTDPANLQTVRRIRIPKKVPQGKVRFMIMSEDLAPSVAANTL